MELGGGSMAGGEAKRKIKLVGCRERAWRGKESYTKGQERMKRGQLERQQPERVASALCWDTARLRPLTAAQFHFLPLPLSSLPASLSSKAWSLAPRLAHSTSNVLEQP